MTVVGGINTSYSLVSSTEEIHKTRMCCFHSVISTRNSHLRRSRALSNSVEGKSSDVSFARIDHEIIQIYICGLHTRDSESDADAKDDFG